MAALADPGQKPKKDPSVRSVEWMTISYRSIYSIVGVLVLIAAVAAVWWYVSRGTPAPTPTPSAASESAARFTAIEGTVRARPVDRPDWLVATLTLLLHRGDLVQTGGGSTAEITFFDDTVLRVRPESLVTIEETTSDPATGRTRLVSRIGTGKVDFNALKSTTGERVREFRTSTMTMQVGKEAEGDVRVGETGDSNVKIFRGTADVRTMRGQNVSLAQNEGVVVDATGQAGEKVVLPTAPVLASPVNDGELQFPNPANATTLLLWKAAPGASAYRVMVDFSPQFNRPLVDRVRKGVSLELHGLDAGKYYWRVASVNAKEIEGRFSEFYRFSVSRSSGTAATAPAPNLEIEALDVRSNILQVKGRSEPGATVTVNGHEIDLQPDGTFNEFVMLERAGKQDVKIRAVGLSGGAREITRSVLVAY